MLDESFKNAAILVVDDQEANIDILVGFLETQGYNNIKSTVHPRTVIALVKSFDPDIILLDLLMPHLSGYEILAQLKPMIPANNYLPILVLTADITLEAKQRALALGAKDFLAKPYDLHEVGLHIKNLLFTRYLTQQLENQKIILEEKVRERTAELEQKITELTAGQDVAEG